MVKGKDISQRRGAEDKEIAEENKRQTRISRIDTKRNLNAESAKF